MGIKLAMIILLVVEAATAYKHGTDDSLTVGNIKHDDRMVNFKEVNMKGSLWHQNLHSDFTHKDTFLGDGTLLTGVRLLNQDRTGDGATAIITGGGPGYTYVDIEFESKHGRGIHYKIELWGPSNKTPNVSQI